MSLTAINAQVYKGTAAVTYGSGSGVSGSQLQGTATITYGGAPTSNTALSLPGTTGSWMTLSSTSPAHFNTATSNIFVEGWIYLNNTTGAQIIFETSNTATSTGQDGGVYFYLGTPYSFIYTSTGSYTTPSAAVTALTWNHVAFAFDCTNNKLYTWTNGIPGAVVSTGGIPKYFASNPVHIGAQLTTGINPLNGYIRDLRVVQGGIVPTTSFTPAAAPFRLNVPSYITGGSTVLSLAEQYFTPSWVSLPGTQGSYLDFGVPNGAYFASTFNTFIQGWVYINSTAANAGYIIMSTPTTEVSAEDWAIRVLSGGTVQFYIYNSSSVSSGVTSSSSLSAGRWYHIAVSYVYNTGTYGTMYMFVNGVLQNSSAMSGGFPRFSPTNRITIGSRLTTLGWSPLNSYTQDLQVVRGGTVPTATFTPAAAPFGLASPSYVSGGTTVLSLATQYYQTGMTAKTLFSQISSAASASAKGIYSLYAVNGASPLVINVRNGTTAVTSDFYGDIFGNLTTSAGQSISSWLGAATGFVTTWYDQSGLGNHAAQVTTALQPSITLGTPNLINFGGTGYFTIANQVMPIGNGVFTTVTKLGTHPTASQIFIWNFGTTGSQGCVGLDLRTDYSPNRYEEFFYGTGDVTGPTYTANATVSGVYNQSSHTLYLNGTQVGTSAVSSRNGASGNQTIGAIIWAPADGRGTTLYTGTMRDLYVFSTALSTADRNIMENGYTGTKAQFTSRPILPAVLVNPGAQTFTNGGTVTVAQTAQEPVNGITWTLAPTGQGVSIASSTDYALTLSTPTAVTQKLFTVTATNKAGLTTVTQFTGATPLFNQISTTAASSAVGVYSLRSLNSVYSRVVNIRNGTTSDTQDFYADTLGNLTTAAGSGQTLASWLGAATGFVTTWYDQSTAGNHATQTTTGAQPQIQRATKGPGFMLVFNNGQYLIGFTYSVLNNTNYTVCKVDRRTASISSGGNGVDNAVVSCGNTGVTNQTLHLTYRSGTSVYYGQYGNDISATITNFSSAATEPIRYNLNMASSTSGRRLYVYNDPLGPILTNSPSATGLLAAVGGNFYIGYYYNNPTYYTGELYEVLIFKTSLYDIDNTGGQITAIYQNQLSYTGT